ncbi:hypothetical protein ACJX0J_015136, partial [Zea mays]
MSYTQNKYLFTGLLRAHIVFSFTAQQAGKLHNGQKRFSIRNLSAGGPRSPAQTQNESLYFFVLLDIFINTGKSWASPFVFYIQVLKTGYYRLQKK